MYAALNGHFSCLQWAMMNGRPWNPNVCYLAAEIAIFLPASNGREKMGGNGIIGLCTGILNMAIFPASNGRERTGVHFKRA
jgi:hypothetical protein